MNQEYTWNKSYNQEYVEITNMALCGKKSVISQQQSYEAFSGKKDIWSHCIPFTQFQNAEMYFL